MIVHRNFSESMVALTAKKSLVKRRELRETVQAFIRDEVNEEDVISISESAFSMGGFYSVTVWYREK
jgi:hypothetical protein